MTLLIPLLSATLLIRIGAWLAVTRGFVGADAWASWPAAMSGGLAAVFGSAAVTHFVEPQRSGLVAIVPDFIPWPELAVTLTGVAEVGLAIGLLLPRLRPLAGVASSLLLIALFPANIVAAGGVAHPDAPSTPLLPRAGLQLILLGFAFVAIWGDRRTRGGRASLAAPGEGG